MSNNNSDAPAANRPSRWGDKETPHSDRSQSNGYEREGANAPDRHQQPRGYDTASASGPAPPRHHHRQPPFSRGEIHDTCIY